MHCFSKEMLISPALLDFLEQAIEPIPVTPPSNGSGAHKASSKTGKIPCLILAGNTA